ncbi:MAG: clostripain-related cysteine peptidase, partial [Acidimicrobiia bacterium]|nr:clostripain-related cysteine peptidase [Acidimicrobiia bacterium]
MTGATSCLNGHPAKLGDRFCANCGAPVSAAAPPPPPGEPFVPPPPPTEPFAPPLTGAPSRPRGWLPVVIGGLAVAAAIVTAVILLGGDDGTPAVTVAATSAPTTPGTAPPETIPATLPPETTPITEGPVLDPDSWTVLVYMVGDNNLEVNALEDLAEMAAVTPQDRFDIVVLADRSAGEVSDPAIGLPDWTDTKLLLIEGAQTTVLSEYGEADMGDPAVLTEFVTTGITDFPAAHYALILWDHGAAVFGIGPDDFGAGGAPSALSPAELGPAIRQALDATGVDRLDIIGFDACLMASLEVAVGMAPVARYMIASEEYEPGVGWDWTALEYLAVEPHPTATGLGETIILQYHQNPVVASIPVHTLSMIDLDGIAAIDTALAALVDPMAASMDQYAPVLGRQRNKTVAFG